MAASVFALLVISAAPDAAHGAVPVTTCGQVVTTDVQLDADLVCIDSDGLVIGADNVTVHMNGHEIFCFAPGDGAGSSCEGAGPGGLADDPDPEIGIDTAGHSGVTLTSDQGQGVLDGFDIGVRVLGGAAVNVVRQVIHDGNAGVGGPFIAGPDTKAILVEHTTCPPSRQTTIHIGAGGLSQPNGNTTGNQLEGFNVGLELLDAHCVDVGQNGVVGGNSTLRESHGILLVDSADNVVQANIVSGNGDFGAGDGGLTLKGAGTTGNLVTENTVSQNFADGISARDGATGNRITNNVMLRNGGPLGGTLFYDAADGPQRGNPAAVNDWAFNNVCVTQTTPSPPPGVCGPGETVP